MNWRILLNGLVLAALGPPAASSIAVARDGLADPSPGDPVQFAAEAERMRREAVAAGDQSYGAVLVLAGAIVGWGPSRVVVERNRDAHAERVSIRDAQRRLGRHDLAGSVLFSTSRPCRICEAAAAKAGVSLMRWGPKGEAAVPRA